MLTVENILKESNIPIQKAFLGEVQLAEKPTNEELEKIEKELGKVGFELIAKRVNKIIEDIKKVVFEYLNLGIDNENLKLSSFITRIFYTITVI